MGNKKYTRTARLFDLYVLCTEKEWVSGFVPLDGRVVYKTIEKAENALGECK